MAAKENQVERFVKYYQQPNMCEGNSSNEATIYELSLAKLYKISKDVNEITPSVPNHMTEHSLTNKVVMLVGATGTGKTTLINRLINHIFGVNYSDKFRFKLVVEKKKTQLKSQTSIITIYKIPSILPRYPFNLTIIDTPGFGDTEGTAEDEKHVDKIRQLFASNTIQSIHAICFVVQYDQQRLTSYQIQVFQRIADIFAKDVKENIFVFATYCSVWYKDKEIKPAPVLQLFHEQDIPYKACYPFNNSDLFDKPEEDPNYAILSQNNWNTSRISFEIFFEELNVTLAISITVSREILEKMHQISEVQLPFIIRKMQSSIHITKDNEKDLEQIENNYKEKDFSYTVDVVKTVYKAIEEDGIFCIKCEKCKEVCHYPCNTSEEWSLKWCSVMSWFNLKFKIYCTVCKCSWKDHKRYNEGPVFETVQEKRTKSDLQEKYLDQMSKEKTDLKTECEKKLVSTFTEILEIYKKIQEFVKFINDNKLSKVEQTVESIIKDKMDSDEKRKEDGWEERKLFIEKLLKLSKENIDKKFYDANSQQKLEIVKKFLHT